MARVKAKNTKPELRVRRAIWRLGHRYRLHAPELPGRPDLVFRKRKLAIFVHGCFWHRHPDPLCKRARWPRTRLDFWRPKLEGNRIRDRAVQDRLEAMGWKVVVLWECQTSDAAWLDTTLRELLGP